MQDSRHARVSLAEIFLFSNMMKARNLWAAIALMMAMGMTACDDDKSDIDKPLTNENNERKDITLTRSEQELVNNSNYFALNLLRKVATEKSVILSPISITYALGMLNNGAAGETQQQICDVLGFGNTGADGINDFCRKMLTEAPQLDKLTKVLISNNIYMSQGYNLTPGFVQKAKDYYDAEPETRNFMDGKTMDVINRWASDHTEMMIEKVLDEDTFDPEAVSYLLNAIYFKGAWATKFDKANTRNEEFKGVTTRKVPMMHLEDEFPYAEDELCQALLLPYGNNAYAMTILLPHEGKTINDVLQGLTKEPYQEEYRLFDRAQVDVKLPSFETNTDINLNEMMSELGMPKAFTDQAEFPNFCDKATMIGLMKQVARIKLNEEGTEAAAVTEIGAALTSVEPEPRRVVFHANRPFLYAISERSTGAIFFIGTYYGD